MTGPIEQPNWLHMPPTAFERTAGRKRLEEPLFAMEPDGNCDTAALVDYQAGEYTLFDQAEEA